ncbi:MAG: SPOR domain-containing protein [Mariprofundaceae bacterium]
MHNDWYKSGMTINNAWIAKKHEYRLILIAAGICIAFVIIALIWPEPSKETDLARSETNHSPVFKIPPRPTQPLTPVEKDISKKSESQTVVSETPSVKPAKIAKPPPVTNQPPPRPPLQHGFYVQVGSFNDPARARKQAAKLRLAGWNVNIVIKNSGMHAVRVGPWQSRTNADKSKARLLKEFKLKGFIVNK